MVFHWSLSGSKFPQVSWTLQSILADLNNAVFWMVSTRPLISKSFSPFINPLVTVPRAPITTGIYVTFMFYSFFNSLARSRYLFFLLSFNFTLWSSGTAKFTILQVLFFLSIYNYYYYYYYMKRIGESPWCNCLSTEGGKSYLSEFEYLSRCYVYFPSEMYEPSNTLNYILNRTLLATYWPLTAC